MVNPGIRGGMHLKFPAFGQLFAAEKFSLAELIVDGG